MYAIIQQGSKQFRVTKGAVIYVDLLEANPGDALSFDQVLLYSNADGAVQVGAPRVPGCIVHGEYIKEVKGPKIQSVKYKRRKNQCRKFGHRQRYAQVKIVDIVSE